MAERGRAVAVGCSVDRSNAFRAVPVRRAASSAALAASLLLGGCAAAGGAIAYRSPPAEGASLRWQHGLVHCADARGARASAETGFLAAGCTVLGREQSGRWRVLSRERVALTHGSAWLIEIVADDDERRWLVLPWHGWA